MGWGRCLCQSAVVPDATQKVWMPCRRTPQNWDAAGILQAGIVQYILLDAENAQPHQHLKLANSYNVGVQKMTGHKRHDQKIMRPANLQL